MMTYDQTMAALEAAGTEQNRKVYRRHGALDPMYGVSYAELGTLTKRIKVNQALAEALWASQNHDARVLATMIADPQAMTEALIDRWVQDVDRYPLTGALASNLVSRTPFALAKHSAWIESSAECVAAAGWQILANLALQASGQPDAWFAERIARIEREIHGAANRVRHDMNGALIAIGIRNEALTGLALASAARIGTVTVDHGATACKTPDAASYIHKVKARRAR